MRKITKQASQALHTGYTFKSGNTQVNKRIGGMELLLHNNLIARDIDNLEINNCGWTPNTTKERLNGVLEEYETDYRLFQKAGTWYLRDIKEDIQIEFPFNTWVNPRELIKGIEGCN